MNKTKIEWVVNPDGSQGYSWNPITGCLNHDNGMCKGGGFPCYAYRLAQGRLRERYLANSILPCHNEPGHQAHHADPFYPRFWTSRLYDLRGKGEYDKAYPTRNAYHASCEKEKGIFVCDMSDLFGVGIPEKWTREVLEQCQIFSQHRFYLLTKQPQNLIKWSPFPDNCWVGVSATDHEQWKTGVRGLREIQAKVKFFSFEPLLHRIGVKFYDFDDDIGWLIIGSQTQPTRHPHKPWVLEILGASEKAGIPVFVKEPLATYMGINRQEYPKGVGFDH